MRRVVVAPICVLTLLPVTARQREQAQQPTFQPGVHVIAADVHVVDGAGQLVPDLKAEGLAITVDAESALVRVGNDWDGFRNVHEVDGKPVADAKDRMAKLFTDTPAGAVERSSMIAAERSQYNMGAMPRNFNVPAVALTAPADARNTSEPRTVNYEREHLGDLRLRTEAGNPGACRDARNLRGADAVGLSRLGEGSAERGSA